MTGLLKWPNRPVWFCVVIGLLSLQARLALAQDAKPEDVTASVFVPEEVEAMWQLFKIPEMSARQRYAQAMDQSFTAKIDTGKGASLRLPTLEEYLLLNCQEVFESDSDNDELAYYRIGMTLWCTGATGDMREAAEVASGAMVDASDGLRGAAKYCFWNFFLTGNGSQEGFQDERCQPLFGMLLEKDMSYSLTCTQPDSYFPVTYLVLLLDDPRYADLAEAKLKKMKTRGLVFLLAELHQPYNTGTELERRLLAVLKGREAEVAGEANQLLRDVTEKSESRLQTMNSQLLISEVDVPSEAEAEALLGGREAIREIRGEGIEGVAKRTQAGRNYIDAQKALLEGIIKRGQKPL